MANVTITFTVTEFCLHAGVSEEERDENERLRQENRHLLQRLQRFIK